VNILVYSTSRNEIGERLRKSIEKGVSADNVEFYQTIDSLSQRLHQPMHDLCVAVLLASTRGELTDILSIRDVLLGIRIVLILPDSKSDTISKGHSLAPRFLTYVDSDFEEVEAVVHKIFISVCQDQGSEARMS
jgi:hypothetical protein